MKKAILILLSVFMLAAASIDEYDRTIRDFTKAIELDPENAVDYQIRGKAYYEKGKYDLAIKHYTKAIELAPENAYAHYHLSFPYHKKGNKDFAKLHILKALNINPNIIKTMAEFLNKPIPYKEKRFLAEELIAISTYVSVPELALVEAKIIVKEPTLNSK